MNQYQFTDEQVQLILQGLSELEDRIAAAPEEDDEKIFQEISAIRKALGVEEDDIEESEENEEVEDSDDDCDEDDEGDDEPFVGSGIADIDDEE
jgi:hypothetical protein